MSARRETCHTARMADVFIDRDNVQVVFGPLEQLGALRSTFQVPVSSIRSVSVSHDPFEAVKGVRAPGVALPGRMALGTWRSRRHGRLVVAAYRGRPALVLEVDGERFDRVVVSTDQAAVLAERLDPVGAA